MLLLAALALGLQSGPIWWEAESSPRTNFPAPDQNPFAPANAEEAAVLSGGKWIGAPDQRSDTLFLEYDVNVPAAGRYQFYARKFWQHGPFRFRFNDDAWTVVRNAALLDDASIRKFVGANWIHAGSVDLHDGVNPLRIEPLDRSGAACFDAFVLSPGFFQPRGKLKPTDSYPAAPPGWFNFDPATDPFKPSPIDLRSLNEKVAGEGGYIQVRNGGFVHSLTGKPEKFWAVNTGHETLELDDMALAHFARSLAKQGVNLVRLHGAAFGDDLATVPTEKAAKIARFVAAMKKEGIYTCLSIYFPLWMQPTGGAAFAGFKGDKHPFATLYFNPEFERQYRGWWTQLLATRNAEGVALKDDPAIALLEMVNEDSMFFWTFTPYENIPAEQMAILEKQFGDWLARRYGSVQKALDRFGGMPVKGDDAAAGRVGFIELWRIFSEKTERGKATAEFMATIQRDFYQRTYDLLHKDLGFKGTVYASNWITANPQILGPLDKWTNTVGDAMDRHGYFGGRHEGERASYSISQGDRYQDRSALLFSPERAGDPNDFSLPIFDIRNNHKPSMITEINWTPPNRYRADFPMVAAAYGSLQGSDAIFYFATGSPSWETTIGKFAVRTPVLAGQFPGTAYLFRKGLVKAGPTVVEANLSQSSLFNLDGSPVTAPQNLDELRKADIPSGGAGRVEKVASIDPLAFLVGRVAINLGVDGPSTEMDLSKLIDSHARSVTSATGELAWDYGQGLVKIDAPMAQGFTGFLSKQKLVTSDCVFSLPLDYGSALVVALDGKPIATSHTMLLQVMSEERPTGWTTKPENGLLTITDAGHAPIEVKDLSGTVSFRNHPGLKVTLLDANGYPVKSLKNQGTVQLAPSTLYYLVER